MENKIEICSAFLFCMRQLFKTLPPHKGDEWTLTMVNLQMSAKFIPKLLGPDPILHLLWGFPCPKVADTWYVSEKSKSYEEIKMAHKTNLS